MANENIDWGNLSFSYMKTDYNVRCTFRDGKWGEIEVCSDENITMHMAASCLHYGQEIFEGLKAFRGADDKVRLFRVDENAKRLQSSAEGIMMEPVPVELFEEMCKKVVQLNARFIPPYGTGSSLYLRPLEIGIEPRVGVSPATEYLFIIFATPVGPYFKGGFQTTDVAIYREFDRAAPLGTGRLKVGGNYACGMRATAKAKANGYSAALFLDPKEKKYLDECGPANFFCVKNGVYITPKSGSILPSITNKSLQQIARDLGMEVECRPVPVEELAEVDEAAECGTAAVATPIGKIYDDGTGVTYVIAKDGKPGPWTTKLYNRLRGIQLGEVEDVHNWNTIIEGF